jgi:hypothetical protein
VDIARGLYVLAVRGPRAAVRTWLIRSPCIFES